VYSPSRTEIIKGHKKFLKKIHTHTVHDETVNSGGGNAHRKVMSLCIGGVVVAPVYCCNNFDELAEGINFFGLAFLAEHIFSKEVNIICLAIVRAVVP
jgi:hypothetical protein